MINKVTNEDLIDEESFKSRDQRNVRKNYNRIFTPLEKIYLSVELRGLILKILSCSLLNPEDVEYLINIVLQENYFKNEKITSRQLWEILNEFVDEDYILAKIAQKIPEFNNFSLEDYKYIN